MSDWLADGLTDAPLTRRDPLTQRPDAPVQSGSPPIPNRMRRVSGGVLEGLRDPWGFYVMLFEASGDSWMCFGGVLEARRSSSADLQTPPLVTALEMTASG